MAQPLLIDPIVSSGPTLVGTGNGTLTVNRLTHFTIAQTYVITCIAKTPDTVFSVVGSEDGPVGLATVGTQFFDADLKIFLTIQQGSTVFEVGDQFTLTVENGTDLNQDNIDDYDELPQKNFGTGVKGTLSGDHNIRYDDDEVFATLYLQDLLYTAIEAGEDGNDVQIQYLAPIPAIPASLEVQDLTFTALLYGASGNAITIEYEDGPTPIAAFVTIQDILYEAQVAGSNGNDITIEYVDDVTAGSEFVTVLGNAITVHIQSGVTTANTIIAEVTGFGPSFALVDATLTGSNVAQTAVAPTNLAGGDFGENDETVLVTLNAILVTMASGLSTANSIKAALDGDISAAALITTTVTGVGTNAQTGPFGPANLEDGEDGVGDLTPFVEVTGNLIQIYFDSNDHTATDIKTAYDLVSEATDLAAVAFYGNQDSPQYSPVAVQNLSGGLERFFNLNQHELTDVPNFSEGNASLLAQSAHLKDKLQVDGHAGITGPLSLNHPDQWPPIPDVQLQLGNQLRRGKAVVYSENNSPLLYFDNQLILASDLKIRFTDVGSINTIEADTFPLADGESLHCHLSPLNTDTLVVSTSSTTDETPGTFRLCTRVGTKLVWFNNQVQNSGEYLRIGGSADYSNNILDILTGGGLITHSGMTLGEMTWDDDFILKELGLSAEITVTANTVQLDDGEVAYIELDDPLANATKPVLVASISTIDLRKPDKYWLFYRKGLIVYVRAGGLSLEQGETNESSSGSGSGLTKVDFLNPISTTLPTGMTVTIDGVSGVDGDLVLFTNLSSGNNQVYELDGVGVSITWTAVAVFDGLITPTDGDCVVVRKGAGFHEQISIFDGTNWKVNDVIRLFDGVSADFWELGSIKTSDLSDNTTDNLFTVEASGSENFVICYSIVRGSTKETGELFVTTDGLTAAVVKSSAYIGDTGVSFTAQINAGDLEVDYTTTSTGDDATMKYFAKRWSDSPGGPTGIPSYSGGGGSTPAAGATTGEIQYRGSDGFLDADTRFKWDEAEGAIDLDGLLYEVLQGPDTLMDNQTDQTIFTYTAATNKFAIIEYSIERNTDVQVGRLLVTTNGSTVSLSDDMTAVGTPGVTFSAAISGPNVLIRYSTSSTGFGADFKYTIRRWS